MSYCPHCNNSKSEVKETRRHRDYESWTQRTRRCYNCNQTFKTVELSLGDLQQIANGDDPEAKITYDAGPAHQD
jgi:transcriptional regulator NrdR family protein